MKVEIKNLLESEREREVITDPEKIKYLLEKYLSNKSLRIQNTFPAVEVLPIETKNDTLKLRIPINFQEAEKLNLYTDIIKHIEIETEVIKRITIEIVNVRVTKIHIAKINRIEKRVKTITDGSVFITNFKISKNKIEKNPMAYSISNKVIFKEFERELSKEHPKGGIKEINAADLSFETKIIKKYKKGILIQDIGNKNHIPVRDDIMRVEDSLRNEFIKIIETYKSQSIKSVLVRPFFYETQEKNLLPMGYIFLKSQETDYTLENYNDLNELCENIINRIKDANMATINIQQRVVNIGNGGLLAEIEDVELQNYLRNRKDFTFDVVFRLQQPLRFYGNIKHIRQKDDNKILVGIKFAGTVQSEAGSPATVNKRFQENLNHLIRHSN
ncbi:MAG: DUF1577 domain-containing protein [Spirochaetia bacterium]|nr:DUF1577 domain-containing protein [Spirochaetia bacterium]